MHGDGRRFRRMLALGLAFSGAACLAWWAVATERAASYQRTERAALERAEVDAPPAAQAGPSVFSRGQTIGSLEIPRLGFSAVVAEGDDEATLAVAVGHLADTPLPWDDGNSALAGHRDGLFRPLEKIRVGDELRVSTPRGDLRYRVFQTLVVDPDDVWVLDAGARPSLTLITCYPFRYVGPAPRRFVVRAEAIDRRVPRQGQVRHTS